MRAETPSVLLIYTGGTIGMIENPESGALENFNFDHLLKHVPELKRFNYRISSYQFNPPIDSSDMEPAYWAKLVKIINYNYDYFDGFVILHGTDTMAYTASALSFMLENLSKPVILTGSQLPIGTLRTDGKENLITAIEIAAAKNPNIDNRTVSIKNPHLFLLVVMVFVGARYAKKEPIRKNAAGRRQRSVSAVFSVLRRSA